MSKGSFILPRTVGTVPSTFQLLQGGPLPVISGVISPINGLING